MRGARANVIPKQPDHASDALAAAARAQERARKAANPSEDGDSREFTISVPVSSDFVLVHGLGRRPRGWQTLSKLSSQDAYESARDSTTITFTNPSPLVVADLRIKVY